MAYKWCIAGSVLGSFLLSACGANFNSIYRTNSINAPEIIITDGAQRAISATKISDNHMIICKEKYPDVFSALASSGSLSINIEDKAGGQGAFSSSQQVGFAGLRTQLRESQARTLDAVCDFYAGGAISSGEVEVLLRRFQNHVLAALAIEQLTGYARPSLVTLGGSAQAGVGAGLVEAEKALGGAETVLEQKMETAKSLKSAEITELATLETLNTAETKRSAEAQKAIKTQETKLEEAKKAKTEAEQSGDAAAIEKAKTAETKETAALETLKTSQATYVSDAKEKAKAQTTKTETATKDAAAADEAVKEQTKIVETLTADRDTARQALHTSTNSNQGSTNQPDQIMLSDTATKYVAKAVTQIVDTAFKQHHTAEQCQRYIFGAKFKPDNLKDVRTKFCIAYFTTIMGLVERGANSGEDFPSTPWLLTE